MSFICEQAGGRAIDGRQRILDKNLTAYTAAHQFFWDANVTSIWSRRCIKKWMQ